MARLRRVGGRKRLSRMVAVEVAGMQSYVELREVEPEDLDHPLEPRDAAVRDASAAVRVQAVANQADVGEQAIRVRVPAVTEPPPHEGQLAPVGLELVSCADLGRVERQLLCVARDRRLELVRDRDERSRRGDLDCERANLGAVAIESERARTVERLRDRRRSCGWIAVHVASDPRAEHERRRRVGQPLAPLAEQIGRGGHQAVLEEPEPVADLVGDAESVVTHLVGLPQEGHLFGDPLLGVASLGREEKWVVEACELLRDADVREKNGASRRFGRMRRQDEPDRRRACALGVAPRDPAEGIVERLRRDPAVPCVVASPSQPVQLLGEVRELEPDPEGAQDECLFARGQRRVDVGDGAVAPRPLGGAANSLDELEQPRAFLLDEHRSEERAQQADVATERRSGVRHVGALRVEPECREHVRGVRVDRPDVRPLDA